MIRYVYRPYHPWRHGYRREKGWRLLLMIARALLVFECLWFAASYVKSHTYERVLERLPEAGQEMENEEEQEVFGIGVGRGDGSVFWFHSRLEEAGED